MLNVSDKLRLWCGTGIQYRVPNTLRHKNKKNAKTDTKNFRETHY